MRYVVISHMMFDPFVALGCKKKKLRGTLPNIDNIDNISGIQYIATVQILAVSTEFFWFPAVPHHIPIKKVISPMTAPISHKI